MFILRKSFQEYDEKINLGMISKCTLSNYLINVTEDAVCFGYDKTRDVFTVLPVHMQPLTMSRTCRSLRS